MPTVQEVLKQSGMTDEQIAGLDAKVIEGVGTVLTTAEQARQAAELAQRAQQEQYEKEIMPALNSWGSEKATLEAQNAFYRTLAEKAKEAGFIPADAPGYTPPAGEGKRGPDGKFVPGGADGVPGSPQFVQEFEQKAGSALATLTDVQWEYQSLFGAPLPEAPSKLASEAQAQRLPFKDYVERKFNFAAKREEKAKAERDAYEKKIRDEAIAERDRFWAERTGGNPNTRAGVESEFSTVRKATTEGQRKDPLLMTEQERRAATRTAIRSEVSEMQATA